MRHARGDKHSHRWGCSLARVPATRIAFRRLVNIGFVGGCAVLLTYVNKLSFAAFSADRRPTPQVCTTVLRVENMANPGCVGHVQSALESVNGVVATKVYPEEKLACISGDASPADLLAAVKSTGKSASLIESVGTAGFVEMTVSELKASLANSGCRGLVLDIDETLSATNVAWFQKLEKMFGNPESRPLDDLIAEYHLAEHVPFWQTEEALEWMQQQRDDPTAQDGLPLVPGAVEGVHALRRVMPIVGYCTVRPANTNKDTIEWLQENGFPDLPVIAKPVDVPFSEGNKWKAAALHELWPEVRGIVDDNPSVPSFAGKDYPGTIYLFTYTECPPEASHAIPCSTWPDVVTAVSTRRN